MIKVKAVKGKLVPFLGLRSEFVGYRKHKDTSNADHVVPDGYCYSVSDQPSVVDDTPYYRRAISRGDLVVYVEDKAEKKSKKDAE